MGPLSLGHGYSGTCFPVGPDAIWDDNVPGARALTIVRSMTRAKITGEPMDLQDLASLLTTDPRVVEENGSYYYECAALARAGGEAAQIYDLATEQVALLNGVGRVYVDGFRGVDFERLDPPGPAFIRLGGVWGRSNATWERAQRRRAVRDLWLAGQYPQVALALDFLGSSRDQPTLFDLYKVYEIVRSDVDAATLKAWSMSGELKTFTESVNRFEVSGKAARHAVLPGRPSGRAMTRRAAHDLIRRLMRSWLDWKT